MTPVMAHHGAPSSRWSIVIAFSLVVVATQVLWVTFAPMTTESATYYHVSDAAVGWLSEVFPLIYVLIAIPCGVLTDRWFRGSLGLGAALTAVGALIRILPEYSWVLAGQIMISVGQPLVVNAINKTASHYVHPRHRPAAIALGSASMFLGILLAMLSGPLLITQGMPCLLWVQAGFTFIVAAWLLWTLRRSPIYTSVKEQWTPVRMVFQDRWIRQLCVLLFVGFGLFIAITTWLQLLLADHGVTDLQAGIALALMTAAGMAGAALIPAWAIRTRRSRLLVFASLISSVATLLVIWLGHPFWLITVLLMISGFLILADLPIVLSTVEIHCPPAQVGTASALLLLFGNAGGIVLALLVQISVGTPPVAILLLVAACVVALPVASRFPLVTPPDTIASEAAPNGSADGNSTSLS